jgi:23S rRNA (uracil1939-C5)-methyltransferase
VSEEAEIVRIAARGDGVTSDGRHVPGGVTGDIVAPDGSLQHGPHHATPPCRHFGKCGGCQLQHADEDALRQFVTDRVVNAAQAQGLEAGELLPTHLSPPRSRRRATLHAMQLHGSAVLGFREAGSHRIVDIKQCEILDPRLQAVLPRLRGFIAQHGSRKNIDIDLALVEQGVDCSIRNLEIEGLAATEAVLDLAQSGGFARLSIDQGYGSESLWEPEPVTITLSGQPVAYPSGSFLQATQDGEDRLVGDACEWLQGRAKITDLFAGLGTFAFALAGGSKVLAVEAARDAYLACKSAANLRRLPVHAIHRDLFRNPLQSSELNNFDGVVLDPPRAGAKEQIGQIAKSSLDCVVYVSCNPMSWARDASQLRDAGFRLEKLRAVGQFRWSTHVELTSLFLR